MNRNPQLSKHQITGIILSGGKNVRMGVNKAFLRVGQRTIIERTAELFNQRFEQVILVTNDPLDYSHLSLEIAVDLVPKGGALIGIYTGLFYASHSLCFIAACDMPCLNPAVIEYMVGLGKNYDVVIPALEDGYHPLHALYSRRCIKQIEHLIGKKNYKITNFFHKVRVREVTPTEFKPFNPALDSFLNINTPQDLDQISSVER
jgi:molybdopterin-guanine dinucleotide biosynthesis protein A